MESDAPSRLSKRVRTSTFRVLGEASLILFVILFLLSMPSLAIPGKRWPHFAFAAMFVILPLCSGARWLRWAGVAGLFLCAVATFNDIQEGKAYDARMLKVIHEYEQQHMTAPASQHDGTNEMRQFQPNTNF
jgi:hypothetical protein